MLRNQMNTLDDSRVRDFDQGHQYTMLTEAQHKELRGLSEQQREVVFKNSRCPGSAPTRATSPDFA